ncbi:MULTISPECIES: hypothetical protein [Methylobacterium]|uniref:Uncharacterized protein n=1 Tax=Methylobacterium jeotgali TaxID=381630 RepID=A0ABQ4SXA0_9HYPH|nr:MULTISPECIES: hypothetical protein [Methylobacterium]PIU08185.1 MAG: hypothetical protein COT56_02355 [Methylobacterium sp. CG09_land_8_20_14_0_10_71_15]PIU15695.1 MAG: hypothetical protein COT28_03605 [Methylobacterium sp. CG08_land_8_20_14_0_20_71_15]GBU17245.1 hypothetical protein AwMethylo_14600 [Methylobacterium sp.]GJE07841.1 hypothetical protein AOPFMNJM_3173 [Methylobacterium jeotgali]
MSRPRWRTPPPPPPVHRCIVCKAENAGIGHYGRWYCEAHRPAAEPAPAAEPMRAQPSTLFEAADVPAPTRFRAPHRRLTT